MHGCACVGVGWSFLFLPLSVLIWFCCISPIFPLLCAFFFLSFSNGQRLEVSRWDVCFFLFFKKSGRIRSPAEPIPGSHLAVKEANLESARLACNLFASVCGLQLHPVSSLLGSLAVTC